ncbi:MAG: hypothetical protein QXK37_04530 [Candidatus Woesearchaeota archaeon]
MRKRGYAAYYLSIPNSIKRGTTLFLLFLLCLWLEPAVYSQECLHYTDCMPSECIGASRQCIDRHCVYSACLTNEPKAKYVRENIPSVDEIFQPYRFGVDETFGMKGLMIIALKVIFFSLALIFVALLISLLDLPGKIKVPIVVIFGISLLFFGVFLFKGAIFFKTLFGVGEIDWNSVNEDYFVPRSFASSIVTKRELTANQKEDFKVIERGKEYRSKGISEETVLVVLQAKEHNLSQVKMPEALKKPEKLVTLAGERISVYERGNYSILIWDEDRFIFFVSAQNKTAYTLARDIISAYPGNVTWSSLYPNDILPPLIKNTVPKDNSLFYNEYISFEVEDADTPIRSIEVTGVDGFDLQTSCRSESDMRYSCLFKPIGLIQGKNKLMIKAEDTYQNTNVTYLNFIYDKEKWVLLESKPRNGEYWNSPSISFKIADDDSGIDEYTIAVEGVDASFNFSFKTCAPIEHGFDCIYSFHEQKDGNYTLKISALDLSGNMHEEHISFVYDKTKPNITLSQNGFVLFDNYGIKTNSVRVDKRPFSIAKCKFINQTYECETHSTEVFVSDLAGNTNVAIRRLFR